MDFLIASPSTTSSFSSSSSSSSSLYLIISRREISKKSLKACQMITEFIRVTVTLVCALVGSIIGAVTGAVVAVTTETEFFKGAGVGAISGALLVIEAAETSNLVIPDSCRTCIFNILGSIDLIFSLLSGRLVYEKVGLAVQAAIQNEITAMEFPLVEGVDVDEIHGVRGISRDAIEKLPMLIICCDEGRTSLGESITCVICIQDFRVGEKATKLPDCHHVFHSQCIKRWLLKHGSCPLCRQSY